MARIISGNDIAGWKEVSVVYDDGLSLSGEIVGYTPACDSPYDEPYIDIKVESGAWYGVLESQIESIERLA
ncbi:MAG: hypothetical protein IKG69_06090 [Atopobiaceae bacterium]|nr:hypothetical protein [Atopobiaceae bacterium]